MKFFSLIFLTILTFNTANAGTEIIVENEFSEIIQVIKEHDKESTLVVFDIDATLLLFNEECEITNPKIPPFIRFGKNIKNCSMKLTEADLAKKISQLQKNKYITVALTARSFEYVNETERELKRNKIKLSKTIEDFEFEFKPGKKWFYQNGTAYAAGKAKGKIMKGILDNTPFNVETVIFVDDNLKNVKSINHTFKKQDDIDFLIYHYTKFAKKKH